MKVLPRPRHDLLIPVDPLALAILQEVYNKTADCIFGRLGEIDHFCDLLHHPVSVSHLSQELRIGEQDVSLQCQFSRRRSFHFLFATVRSLERDGGFRHGGI